MVLPDGKSGDRNDDALEMRDAAMRHAFFSRYSA